MRIPLSADMDLGVLLESPQGSQSSSRVGACTCAFLLSCSSIVTLTFAWIKGSVAFPRGFPTRLSHQAFPRGFPTGLSHVPPRCESILGLNVDAVRGKQVSLELTEPSGGLLECSTTLEFLSPFLWRAPPLDMRRERREFFPVQALKGSLLSRSMSALKRNPRRPPSNSHGDRPFLRPPERVPEVPVVS